MRVLSSCSRRTALAFVAACCSIIACAWVAPARAQDAAGQAGDAVSVSHLRFVAEDGVEVFADFYASAAGKSGPLVLLFHQAGSNAAEYEPIAPRLVAKGYSCLALDQRSGGRRWDRNNRTVLGIGRSADFSAAYQDLEAALAWARDDGWQGPLVAWGSSYSAALVFRLAAEHDDVTAILAFSPGEYFGAGDPVRGWASRVSVPVYATSAGGREVIDTRRILDAVQSPHKAQYVARVGVHGSSTLRRDRNPLGHEENWQAVDAFLRARVGPGSPAGRASQDAQIGTP